MQPRSSSRVWSRSKRQRTSSTGVPVTLGPFRVTPWRVDHSAYDAHSLPIEAGGKRLLYSGDIRSTGRKPGTLEMIATEACGVDTLLLEGTRMGRPEAAAITESDVEAQVHELLLGACGPGLAFFSSPSR